MSSIPQKVTNNKTPSNETAEMLNRFANVYLRSQRIDLRETCLVSIGELLMQLGVTRYVTSSKFVIEEYGPEIRVYPKSISEDGCCPDCKSPISVMGRAPVNLLMKHGQVQGVIQVCGYCGKVFRIMMKRCR